MILAAQKGKKELTINADLIDMDEIGTLLEACSIGRYGGRRIEKCALIRCLIEIEGLAGYRLAVGCLEHAQSSSEFGYAMLHYLSAIANILTRLNATSSTLSTAAARVLIAGDCDVACCLTRLARTYKNCGQCLECLRYHTGLSDLR